MIRPHVLTLTLLCACAVGVRADDVTLNFTGNVIAATCTVDPTSINTSVPLGKISTTALSGSGAKSNPTPFDLVINCPTNGPGSATVRFNATPDSTDPTLVALDGVAGSASGVAIRIAEPDGTTLPLNTASATRTLISGQNTLTFQASYQALVDRPDITPGVANGSAQFTINYQ